MYRAKVISVKVNEGTNKEGRAYWWQDCYIPLDDGTIYPVRNANPQSPVDPGAEVLIGVVSRFGHLDLEIQRITPKQ